VTIDNMNRLEWAEELAATYALPESLREFIADAIEPHTQNCRISHEETMDAIAIAYPLIVQDVMREISVSLLAVAEVAARWTQVPPMPPPDGEEIPTTQGTDI
jgi:hypothetical protein